MYIKEIFFSTKSTCLLQVLAQSRRHGGGDFGGFSPQTKLQTPKLKHDAL